MIRTHAKTGQPRPIQTQIAQTGHLAFTDFDPTYLLTVYLYISNRVIDRPAPKKMGEH